MTPLNKEDFVLLYCLDVQSYETELENEDQDKEDDQLPKDLLLIVVFEDSLEQQSMRLFEFDYALLRDVLFDFYHNSGSSWRRNFSRFCSNF
jgi:hypothetical protein